MSIDIVIFSRNRERELQKTISRLKSTKFRVLIFHNSASPLKLDCEAKNVQYFYCPQKSYGERAKEAKQHLKNPFSIICSDDDGIVEGELQAMQTFLITNSNYATVGGDSLGAFPYGSFISGTFAYKEMSGYLNTINDPKDRIETHMSGSQIGSLPRAAMYRLFRKNEMEILLDSFSICTEVKTPYIFEVVSELISAWLGPNAYLPNIYWIRNWKTQMVTHSAWDREFEFYDWWNSDKCESERSRVLTGLSEITKLNTEFIYNVFSNYAINRKLQFSKETKVAKSSGQFGRKMKQYVVEKVFPEKVPPEIARQILVQYPTMTKERLREICRVAEEMFL